MSDKVKIKFKNGSVISGITYADGKTLRGISRDNITFLENEEARKADHRLARDNTKKTGL